MSALPPAFAPGQVDPWTNMHWPLLHWKPQQLQPLVHHSSQTSRGSHPSVHTGNLISVGYCANSLASTRQHWIQMPDTVVTIFDSSGNLPPNLGAGGPGRPMFSSTSGAAAKTSSVLSALTAYWKYPSLCKTENLTSKKYLSNVQGVEVMGLFIVKAAGLPC